MDNQLAVRLLSFLFVVLFLRKIQKEAGLFVRTLRNCNKLSFDIKKAINVKKKLYTNLIAEKIEIGNFEYLLNN